MREWGLVAWQSEVSREASLVSGRCKDARGAAEWGETSHEYAVPDDEEVSDGRENSANNLGQTQTSVGVLPAQGTW